MIFYLARAACIAVLDHLQYSLMNFTIFIHSFRNFYGFCLFGRNKHRSCFHVYCSSFGKTIETIAEGCGGTAKYYHEKNMFYTNVILPIGKRDWIKIKGLQYRICVDLRAFIFCFSFCYSSSFNSLSAISSSSISGLLLMK